MEFHFCEKCGRKITEADLEMGSALMMGEEFYCSQCKDAALAEMAGSSTERAAPPVAAGRRGPASGTRRAVGHRTSGPRRAVSGRGKRATGPRPAVGVRKSGPREAVGGRQSGRASDRMRPVAPEKSGSNTPVIAAIAAAVVGGVVAFLIFGRGGGGGVEEQPKPRTQEPPKVRASRPEQPKTRPPVVKSVPVGVPLEAKDANDFEPVNPQDAPAEADTYKVLTAENAYEIQAAVGPTGWKVLRSKEAKRIGERGIRVSPDPEREPRPSAENQVAIRLSRAADLSGYKKLGFWMGGKNVEKNMAKVSIVVGTEETPLTGTSAVEYGTRWKYYTFDLVGKRDDVRGIIVHFNASSPPSPPNFELYLDDVAAFGGGTREEVVAARPETPAATTEPPATTYGPSLFGPRRGAPPPRREAPPAREPAETTGPATAPPPRPRPPVREEPSVTKPEPTPAAPAPPVALPPASGDFSVVWRETFDKGEKAVLGWSGVHEPTLTYQGSAGARSGEFKADSKSHARSLGFAYWRFPGGKRALGDKIFDADDAVFISFYYYLEGDDEIDIYAFNPRAKNNLRNNVKGCIQGKWTAAVLKSMDFNLPWDKKVKAQKGDKFTEMSFAAGKAGDKNAKLIIDNFTITKGGAPRDVELQIARSNKLTADQTGDPVKEGFFLLPNVVTALKQSYDPKKTTKGKVLKVGGDSASSMFHIYGIDGVTAVKRFSVCGKKKGVGDVIEKLPGELAAQKPEVVTVMFDVVDLAKQRSSMEARGHYIRVVEAALATGSVPVLFTLPLPRTGDKDADKLIGEYNKAIMSVGREKNVPVVDANTILLADPAKLTKFFTGPKLKKAAHDELNRAFKGLYEKLAKHVMGRE